MAPLVQALGRTGPGDDVLLLRTARSGCADGDFARHGAGRLESGAIFALTGSYRAAFVNGLAWNLLNVSIVVWLLVRARVPSNGLRTAA